MISIMRPLYKLAIVGVVGFLQSTQSGFCQRGTVIIDSLKSINITHTLTNEDPVRKMSIYLPPRYESSKKRYPVIYLFQGIGDDHLRFVKDTTYLNNIRDVMDYGVQNKMFREMIIVMPNTKTKWMHSLYMNSPVTGNWEDFVVYELINYIDAKYRTVKSAGARALVGHSMGGFGAIYLGIKHPDKFSVVYGMNPALFCFCGDIRLDNPGIVKAAKARTADELLNSRDYYAIGTITFGQAFSPNPNKPPFYTDLPFIFTGDKVVFDTAAKRKWEDNDIVLNIQRYADNIKKLKAIKFDSGYDDEFKFIPIKVLELSKKLEALGIKHFFEEYNGDHRNRLWGRDGRILNEVIPFVDRNLN